MTDSCPLAPYTEACQLEAAEHAALAYGSRAATAAAVGAGPGPAPTAGAEPAGSCCSMEEGGAVPQQIGLLR